VRGRKWQTCIQCCKVTNILLMCVTLVMDSHIQVEDLATLETCNSLFLGRTCCHSPAFSIEYYYSGVEILQIGLLN